MDVNEFMGEIREFKRATLTELHGIKKDVKALNKIHWKVAGGTAAVMLLLTIAVQAIAALIH